jgi:UDP-N-acetylmuramyl tripeptide synthase
MSSLRLRLASVAGNSAGALSRALGRGRGETLTGRVILACDPKALEKLATGRDIILVSGTNGKTTSTANLARILEWGTDEGVSTSKFGANMTAGITAALAENPRHRFAVLECDEMYLPAMYEALRPKVVVLLNLSRDQLHRTGEVRKIANLWHKTFTHDDVTLVIDRDDPFLEYAASQAGHVVRVTFGGRKHPDAATCPNCSQLLDWSSGDYFCSCGLGSELAQIRGDKKLLGPARNTVLAIEAARLMGAEISVEVAAKLISESPDRMTEFTAAGVKVPTRLAKNPESWRGALQAITAQNVVLSLNARGIDGRDTSWLWDIDYSSLVGRNVVCTGDRRLDIAYRLQVQGCAVQVAATFSEAVELCESNDVEAIASYTAFQDLNAAHMGIRQVSGGRA